VRKLSGLALMLLMAVVLTACGGDDDDDEPTTAPVEPTPTTAVTEDAATATPDDSQATPAMIGTPAVSGTPDVAATPVTAATPIAAGSPVSDATPGAGTAGPAVVPEGTSDEPGAMQALSGTVSLPGTINEAFVIGDDGCVGLGEYAGVQAGQQVVVRDEAGAIVGVSELAATGSAVVCTWTFDVEIPESGFYEVSVPLIAEQVYTQDEIVSSNGQIELMLP